MKKNFLFGTLAVLLAGFWFGGASLADCATSTTKTDDHVASITVSETTTYYCSLREAVAAVAADNTTIDLIDNDETSFVVGAVGQEFQVGDTYSIIIDGHNKYIKGVSDPDANWHDLYIAGDKDVTIKNLTFKNFGDGLTTPRDNVGPIYVGKTYNGKLTIDNVTITDFNRQAIHIGGGTFEITNSTIEGDGTPYQQGIEIGVNALDGTIDHATISGIIGNDNWSAYAIGQFGNSKVTVTNSTITNSEFAAGVGSVPSADWGTAINGELVLGDGNKFSADHAISVASSKDGYSVSSKITVTSGSYNGTIEKSEEAADASAKIEISGGKFSVDPSAYVVAGKVAKSISEAPYAFEVANPDPTPSYSGGGGGGGSSKASTKNDTKATDTDKKADETKAEETKDDEKVAEEAKDQQPSEEKVPPMTDAQAVAKFGQEQIDAYKWALENGITTMETVEEARLDYPLTRAELAKMMVVYIAKILGKQPVLTGNVGYQDVDANKLGDLAGYIQLAYQYQIMGIDANGDPIEFFNPNGLVTRGEYATVFSRVLFGALFNKEGEDFYTDHIEALNKAGILSDTNPTQREMRGWVMLMMYRSTQNADKIASVIEALGATEEEVADAQAKAEEEAANGENAENAENPETVTEENAEATTGDVAEAPEAEANTGAVAE